MTSKSSTVFFSSKTKSFSKKNHFLCFYHISSPISESVIAQLLLHRALDKKLLFFTLSREIPGIFLTNFLKILFRYLTRKTKSTKYPQEQVLHRSRISTNLLEYSGITLYFYISGSCLYNKSQFCILQKVPEPRVEALGCRLEFL